MKTDAEATPRTVCPPTISYGGGVQSTALLVLAARGIIDYPVALFANTGDDSESPETLAYIREIAVPFARDNGIEVVELRRTKRDNTPHPTLLERILDIDNASVPIPVRMSEAGVPASRTCTADYKGRVLAQWRKAQGATAENRAVVAIGFSTDEAHRANKRKAAPWEAIRYPLLDLGHRRSDCEMIIRDGRLPVPPKSACWFCPWHNITAWRDLKRTHPDRFRKAVLVEAVCAAKSRVAGSGPVWMTDRGWKYGQTLDVVVGEGVQGAMFDDGPQTCDTGACWT